MKIYDMHIHAINLAPTPEALLTEMGKAGIYGGCVFSNPPKEQGMNNAAFRGGTDFEERLSEALSWARGYEGRIFPVLWIHPEEENIIDKVHIAAEAGIAAFKMICSNFYVYEDKPMAVLREIAKIGKPVIFHSGILWDSKVSSKYNRPLNWEALLDIDGLRFSMGHCSWPWIDECIALYGKFLNSQNGGKNAEMFFDITPGTPENYREELLSKLYLIGYNVGDNILFGLDSRASEYRSEWATNWLNIDGKILDKLGVSARNREKLYSDNLMRFLGISTETATKEAPATDNSHKWYPQNPEVKRIIRRWYDTLAFPESYNAQFEDAMREISISDAITLESYDKGCKDGRRTLLSMLYLCEGLKKRYEGAGIPEEYLLATLRDLPIWTVSWSNVKGSLYLGELAWLSNHLGMKLFRIGRLQFCMAGSEHNIPKYNIKKGDNVIEVHIPEGEKLSPEECQRSLTLARRFFAEYFPGYEYTVFTCHSWLLDDTLKMYLPEESNIIRFGNMFDKVESEASTALIRYIFRWDTTPENLKYAVTYSGFSERIKAAVLSGEVFHETLGIIKK